MKTEKEKMLAGEFYFALDLELVAERRRARDLTHKLNQSRDEEQEMRLALLSELLGRAGENAWIEPPFYCDYGSNIFLGDTVFFNFNCVLRCRAVITHLPAFGFHKSRMSKEAWL